MKFVGEQRKTGNHVDTSSPSQSNLSEIKDCIEPRCLQRLQKQRQRQRHLPCQIRVCILPLLLNFYSELDQPEIQQNYIRMQNELQVLARKIGELESEADEHTSVFP